MGPNFQWTFGLKNNVITHLTPKKYVYQTTAQSGTRNKKEQTGEEKKEAENPRAKNPRVFRRRYREQ
jgi:hypothetical protein